MYGNLDPYANHLTNGAKKTKNPFKDDKPRVTPEYIDNLTLADYGWTPEAIKNSFMFDCFHEITSLIHVNLCSKNLILSYTS